MGYFWTLNIHEQAWVGMDKKLRGIQIKFLRFFSGMGGCVDPMGKGYNLLAFDIRASWGEGVNPASKI